MDGPTRDPAQSTTRRGRRVVLPDERTTDTPRERANARFGWLLTTNRLLGRDPELSRRTPFLAALEQRGRKVDASTVSRWESGRVDISDHTATLYEQALGLASGSLVAVHSGVRRALHAEPAPARHREPDDELFVVDLEPVVDRVSSGHGTGADWLGLTRCLGAFDLVRMRQDEWARLSHRIIDELGSSVGFAFVRRYEAAVDLFRLPEAVHHLTEAVARFVTTPDVQRVFPVLALLSEVDDEHAGAISSRLLESENPVVRLAATWTVVGKLARGHRAGLDPARVEAHVRRGLTRGESVSARLESANLAAQLPAAAWARLKSGLQPGSETQMVDRAREQGHLMYDERVADVLRDLAETVMHETPMPVAVAHNEMLSTLLHEAILDTNSTRRHQATVVISASPYAGSVARHGRALAHSDYPVLAARMQELLIQLGGIDPRGEGLENALADDREAIRARALMAIGVHQAELRAGESATLLEHTVGSTTPMDRAAGLFALGMSGSDNLHALAEHDDLAAAARWWTTNGPALHDPDTALPTP